MYEQFRRKAVFHTKYNEYWARLIAKVNEVDPFKCSKCGSTMKFDSLFNHSFICPEDNGLDAGLVRAGSSSICSPVSRFEGSPVYFSTLNRSPISSLLPYF